VTKNEFNFDGRFYDRKPPVVIPEMPTSFICVECGKPGESTSRKAKTHPGACRLAHKRKTMDRANVRLRQKRAAARKSRT